MLRLPRASRTPAQHVAHHGHRLLVGLGGIAAVLILVVVAGIWRLLQGPIELDRLVPYVEQALQRSGIGVAVAGISIGIDRETHQLDLQAQNVRLSLPNGEKLANVPEMATSLSLGAMLGGRIEPTRIVVKRPALALIRDANGALSFTVGSGDSTADQADLDSALGIFDPLKQGSPWSQLRRIEVRDATIIVDDRVSGKIWRASHAAATLERSGDVVTGDVSFAITLGKSAPELHARYRIAAPSRILDLSLAIDGLDPAALATLSPALAPLAQAQFSVSGTADLRFDLATGTAQGGRVDLGFGAGQIQTDLLAGGHLPVRQGELHADYAPETAELRLERLALDLQGETTLVVDGRLGGLQPQLVSTGALPKDLRGTLGATLTHVPTGRLTSLWPVGVSPGGRKWVAANLSDGMLDEMAVQLAVAVDPATMSADFSDTKGTFRYHDLTVDYFNGLPPAKKVSGTATLGDRRLDFALAAGATVKSLKTTGGTISIANIGPDPETLTIDIGVTGPVPDALEVLDSKSLRYAHDARIDLARVGGRVDTQVHFQFPLLTALKLADIDYGAKATLSGVSYGKVAFDRPLTDGNFTLDLGHDGVHAKGNGKFDGSAATIDGNLYFHRKSGPRMLYRIGLVLDDAARQRLGWDFLGDRLSGPVAVDLTYTVPTGNGPAEVVAMLNLAGAGLAYDEANWKKPPQSPGSAKLVVTLSDEVVTAIPEVAIKAGGLDVRFAVAFTTDHRIDRVDIRRFIIADNDIGGVVTRRVGGGWQADLHGARLNLHRPLKRALENDEPDNSTPLAINARVARVMLGPHREARDVSAVLLRDRGEWQSMRIDGSHLNGRRFALTLGGTDANRKLHFRSDDLGATFALFGIADNVVGGKVTVDATVGEVAGHHVIHAHIDGTDYTVQRAPTVAQILSLASIDGLGVLAGGGIPFSTLRGDVSFSRGTISLQRVVAYGGALGLSVKGWLNPGEDKIDVDGTLAPAYALNSVLGHFPVIGALLTGGEGQGMFAWSFRLTGSNDNPSVMVNPLSALTPGLLRHLFDPFTGSAEPEPQQQH